MSEGDPRTEFPNSGDHDRNPVFGQRGWFSRFFPFALLREVKEVHASLQALRGEFHALMGEFQSSRAKQENVEQSLNEAREHLETRINQISIESADLRSAYLTTRGEFENLRDRLIPALEKTTSTLAGEVIPVLQRELESIRDQRLPQTQHDLATMNGLLKTLQSELESLRDHRIQQAEQTIEGLHSAVTAVSREMEILRDERIPHNEGDLYALQTGLQKLIADVELVRDLRLPRTEADLKTLHGSMVEVQTALEQIRDQRIPSVVGRTDALLGKLHEELSCTTGMVERIMRKEPLTIASSPALEARLPEAIRAASKSFSDTFRGSSSEIALRLAEYLPILDHHEPLLDLGCGRGELLTLMQQRGLAATGIDSDPAMVEGCRDRGLHVDQADVIQALYKVTPQSVGAITAIHLLEHLPAAVWMTLVEVAAKALKSNGLLIIECPNPQTLRVVAGEFWIDPTHHAPIHPDALAFVIKAVGLDLVETRLVHPFPPEQSLAQSGQSAEVHDLAKRLDTWLSGPRDFIVIARKTRAEG